MGQALKLLWRLILLKQNIYFDYWLSNYTLQNYLTGGGTTWATLQKNGLLTQHHLFYILTSLWVLRTLCTCLNVRSFFSFFIQNWEKNVRNLRLKMFFFACTQILVESQRKQVVAVKICLQIQKGIKSLQICKFLSKNKIVVLK